jgi:hypothetical protein
LLTINNTNELDLAIPYNAKIEEKCLLAAKTPIRKKTETPREKIQQ